MQYIDHIIRISIPPTSTYMFHIPYPFQAKKRSRLCEDDSVVIVPSMKRLIGSSFK